MRLAAIFEKKPERWGFRGDPYFWDHLKELAKGMDALSPDELEEWIKREYLSLSGKELTDEYGDFAVIDQFAHGGMSSGGVDNLWWIEEGIPLLKSRLAEMGCSACNNRTEADMKSIKLHRVSFSPGYSDMLGGYHESTLRKGEDGSWTFFCSDREVHSEPTVTAIYAVNADAAEQFEKFITDSKIFSLEDRPKSDIFATDYSPWNWSIDYETTSFGKTKREYCSFGEYKRYSRRDHELLSELERRFVSLRGEKISETVEEN